jgi:hypothetical protein
MTAAALAAGLLLLALLLVDVVQTVFVPRGGPGPVTRRAHQGAWAVWRVVALRLGGRRLLALGGPLLLPLTVLLWSTLLVVGFALLYLPGTDRLVYQDDAPIAAPLAALYLSGLSATTLGVGDVHPGDALLRLSTTVQAGCGFALFSVSIAYVLAVYGALRRSTALAVHLSHFLDSGMQESLEDEVAALLGDAVRNGEQQQVLAWVADVTRSLLDVAQEQEHYPLIEYFHAADDDRALPLALPRLLVLLTCCRALLDPQHHRALSDSLVVRTADRTARWYLEEHLFRLRLSAGDLRGPAQRRATHERLREALGRRGVALRPAADSWPAYDARQSVEDSAEAALRRHFGYPPL